MDIDDDSSNHRNHTTNGLNTYEKVASHSSTTSTNTISNGHALVVNDRTEHEHRNGYSNIPLAAAAVNRVEQINDRNQHDIIQTMDIESISSHADKCTSTNDDHQLLARILRFGRELHTLKHQLTIDSGENAQNDKMLQVNNIENTSTNNTHSIKI
jgi:hypothetical protein